MRSQALVSVLGALALGLSSSACVVLECNAMYAPDALQLTFDPALEGDGEWTVTLSGDLDAGCSVTLPLPTEDAWPVCDMEGVELLLSEDYTRIEGVSLFALAPEAVTLTVALDGEEILSQAITPEYDVDEPNGKGCGERHFAEVVVATPISGD